jgi:hypothetical protein
MGFFSSFWVKKMSRRKPTKRGIDTWTAAFAILIFILLLKELGILKAYFNIDPNSILYV